MAGGIPDLIFLHQVKTGGSTLRRMLSDRYGDAVYVPDLDPADSSRLRYLREETDTFDVASEGNDRQLARWRELSPAEQRRLRVFMGHFWYGVHDDLGLRPNYITIIRDPIDRVLSLHAHYRQRRGLTVPFDRYVRSERDWEISNGQTRRLATSGLAGHIGDVTQTMFDVAAERLTDHFTVVGTTERFDDTVIALAHALGWRTPVYKVRNVSVDRLARHEVPESLLERLRARNVFDAQLHAFASDRLDKALVGIDVPAALQRLRRANKLHEVQRQARTRLDEAKVLGTRATRAVRRRFGP